MEKEVCHCEEDFSPTKQSPEAGLSFSMQDHFCKLMGLS